MRVECDERISGGLEGIRIVSGGSCSRDALVRGFGRSFFPSHPHPTVGKADLIPTRSVAADSNRGFLVRGFINMVTTYSGGFLCANDGRERRSKLRQTKAVANYRTPRAPHLECGSLLAPCAGQLAAAPTKIGKRVA